ncbi:MAG: hypothetical protein ACD_75C01860G0004 [uncultured bacterium]|nr:MAG: hypothetical protein ACD_75C01860G0004 [uncultured bacterium]
MMLTIDLFKKINDDYGHQKGDDVFVKVAGIIKQVKRKADVVARMAERR